MVVARGQRGLSLNLSRRNVTEVEGVVTIRQQVVQVGTAERFREGQKEEKEEVTVMESSPGVKKWT